LALQNRVTPLGELVATPERGEVYGNRGCLHDAGGVIRRRWSGRRWIACRLEFKGWQRGPLLQPGRFTELFFLDEVTAFAAGHRPCFECRRRDALNFAECWQRGHSLTTRPAAADMDAVLHEQRLDDSAKRRHVRPAAELPDGAVVVLDGRAFAVHGDALMYWTPDGYATRRPRPRSGTIEVLTPPAMLAVLTAGYPVRWHASGAGTEPLHC